jgi:hypothetical protein
MAKIGLQNAINFSLSVMISQPFPNRGYSQYTSTWCKIFILARYLLQDVNSNKLTQHPFRNIKNRIFF